MNRQALDYYMDMPREMKSYLRLNGWHFNKRANDYAVSLMRRKNPMTGKSEKIEALSKEVVDDLLKRNNVSLENNVGYDYVYVANMVKADMWKSSVEDEKHHVLAIKDFIDDEDQADGYIMHRWYSDMVRKGIPIVWEDLL